MHGETDFFRSWLEYQKGFGDIEKRILVRLEICVLQKSGNLKQQKEQLLFSLIIISNDCLQGNVDDRVHSSGV